MAIPRSLLFALLAGFATFALGFSDNYLAAQVGTGTTKTTSSLLVKPSFRISETSTVFTDRGAASAEVAYNADDNEYLVVWESDGLTELKGVKDIYGQRLSAATNERIGIGFRISNLTDVDKNFGSNRPKIVYNRTAHEYLVVWYGTGLLNSPDRFFEVYGQRLSRVGKLIGTNFRISHATDLGKINTNIVRSSGQADVAWNGVNNEYLVIWRGIGEPEDVVKMEIYGQRLKSEGELLGKSFRISHTTDQGSNIHATAGAIAYNSKDNQYLIVWTGGFKNESQVEVWGTLLSAAGVVNTKTDFRISHVTDLGANRMAGSPRVVYNAVANQYLVVFQANGLRNNEDVTEIFGHLIDGATPTEVGPNDFRISNASDAGNSANKPAVSFDSVAREYVVIWRSTRLNGAYEAFGKRITVGNANVQAEFQISNIGVVGKDRTVNNPALGHNTENGEYLVIWQGNGLPGSNTAKITEIFGQQLVLPR